MSERDKHLFQFKASEIALAAEAEAAYHDERATYWQTEMDTAYARVQATIGAKITKQDHTGGWSPAVVVDYGDPAAYARMGQAAQKVQQHQKAAERFETDERLYHSQGERVYDLSTEDVHYFRLGGGPRDD